MKLPYLTVPATILAAALGGLGASHFFAIPSVAIDFPGAGEAGAPAAATLFLLVDGVRCVDTARRAATTLEELPGIRRFVAYASRARVEIEFDPRQTGRQAIVEALEGPVLHEATGEYRFGVYRVVEVDGAKVNR